MYLMQRTLKDYLIITLKGLAMGAADVVPGVSGGTIAFISGIYEELITTISGVNFSLITTWKNQGFAKAWQQLNGNFLLALVSGIAISIFSLMKLTRFLLENHPILVWAFFFGLVLASVLFIGKQITKWTIVTIITLLVAAGLAYYITILPPLNTNDSSWFLFLSGALAICAMILPGISGAFILVLLGSYKTILDAVHEHDLKTIVLVGLGAITGLLSFSRVLKWLFKNYENITLAGLTGFVLGSLNKIWPWKKVLESNTMGEKVVILKERSVLPANFEGEAQLTFALVLMVIGFLVILSLEKLANLKKT